MRRTHSGRCKTWRRLWTVAAFGVSLVAAGTAQAQINRSNWGSVTSPVFGTSEAGAFAGVELFAGPNKFGGNYYHGVLPNGRIVKPVGLSAQVGANPLGLALTPDCKFLLTSNDAERGGMASLQNSLIAGGYSLSVIDTQTMQVVSQAHSGAVFLGLQITGSGPYTVWASGGPSNSVKLFQVSADGKIDGPTVTIPIKPTLPANAGFVSHYLPDDALNTPDALGDKPPVPTNFERGKGAQITYPAGSALSPDGKLLYVACNGDNSLAIIATATQTVLKQIPVGYFPYGVSVSRDGTKVCVANWGVTEYKFKNPTYGADGKLQSIGVTGPNHPDGYYVPKTDTTGPNPKTSSISILSVPAGNGASATLLGSVSMGHPLDEKENVGDTHPCATAIVHDAQGAEVLYVAKANSDALGLILLNAKNEKLRDFDLSPLRVQAGAHHVHGAYPNALAVSPDNTRLYVAEAGLNSVAVLDTTVPTKPKLLGRIPAGWYPSAVATDGKTLYVLNAKGIGEDINPKTASSPTITGVESFRDSNFMFGSAQKVALAGLTLDNTTVLGYNFALHPQKETAIIPLGGEPSRRITHVFFILHENKSFDSMLGNRNAEFGPLASTTFNNADGTAFNNRQNTGVSVNTQLLATTFAAAANYYSDSEESDAGHQFAASGTASDYSEKTLLVKDGRGLLADKNMEPEDYPEGGYLFNNAARNNVSFKDYGDLLRIVGTDTGESRPSTLNDPGNGRAGLPKLQSGGKITSPLENAGDVASMTRGLGQSYFLALPALAILGGNNRNGEPHLDHDYPGYNFNISDQRRALEFIRDFDRMQEKGTLPALLYIYQPNDHGGGIQAPNRAEVGGSFLQQVADGDVALGMVVQHIMKSPVYYNAETGAGSAIFVTYDDAQGSMDHIHPHRTPLLVISPYAKAGYVGKKHYVTASIVKTEELLLGLPPNNYGDLFATDLRDLFQPQYNRITPDNLIFTRAVSYKPSPEGVRIWELVAHLDTSAPDRDSRRLGRLARLSAQADDLHTEAERSHALTTPTYQSAQAKLYQQALTLVSLSAERDSDD